ncbi:hypothetical protein VNO77_42857 [Canavalia gladiata]|uniref:RNA helicase n=1 Tax=Canavalia gladiata TaxID=3824 RepID=A0AAN9JVA1_CANGL
MHVTFHQSKNKFLTIRVEVKKQKKPRAASGHGLRTLFAFESLTCTVFCFFFFCCVKVAVMANVDGAGPSQQLPNKVDEPVKVLREKNLKILNDFVASKDQVYIFRGKLPGEERAVLNDLCQRLGLGAKFRGRMEGRKIYVYKMNNEATSQIQVAMSKKRKNREEPESCWNEQAFYDEFNRVWISQALEKFLASNDEVYNFEDELSPEERVLVTELSQKMGLSCTFSGLGIGKKTSVHKTLKEVDTTKVEPHAAFSELSNQNKEEPESPQHQNSIVDESARNKISLTLENFLASKDEVYNFETNLSPEECVAVYQLSQKMGFSVENSGSGIKQKVSVHKIKKKIHTTIKLENLPCFTFSEESQQVLCHLLMNYPPDDEGLWDELVELWGDLRGTDSYFDSAVRKKDFFFSRPCMSKDEITKKLEDLSARMKDPFDLKLINEKRSKLPIASFKDVITSTVESRQVNLLLFDDIEFSLDMHLLGSLVVIICGETGCGKTTQVPQYILDHMWGKGEVCKIFCTQPHHISATSVCERISRERGEKIGDSIGYMIQLESRVGRQSSIVLCTTGVLLKALVSNSSHLLKIGSSKNEISGLTHIIMDEIHERDSYSDVMLVILSCIVLHLRCCRAFNCHVLEVSRHCDLFPTVVSSFLEILPSNPHLRLILMSASVDVAKFSQYFGVCPIIHITGFTYPVRTYYLEDVLSIVKDGADNHLDINHELGPEEKRSLDKAINLAWSNDKWCSLLGFVSSEASPKVINYQHSLTGLSPLMVFAGKGKVDDMCMLLFLGADCQLRAKDGTTALEIVEKENQCVAAELLKKYMDSDFSNNEGKSLLDKYFATVNPKVVDVVLIEQLIRKICIDSKDGGILVFLPSWDEVIRTHERLLASQFFRNRSKFMVISLHSMVPSIGENVFISPRDGCRKIVLSTNIAESAVTVDDIVYVIDIGHVKEKNYDPCDNVLTLQSSWISKASAKQREGHAGRCQPGICYHLYSKVQAASLPDFQVPEIKRMPIEDLCLQVKLFDPSCKIEEFLNRTLDPPGVESIRNAVGVLREFGALTVDEQLTHLGEKLGSLPVHPSTSRMLLFSILMNCLGPALTLACVSEYKDPFVLPILPGEKERAAAARSELASLYGCCGDQFAVLAAFQCWLNSTRMGLESQFCSRYFVSKDTMKKLSRMRMMLAAQLSCNELIHGDVSYYCSNDHDPGILQAVLVAGMYPMVGKLLLPNESGEKFIVQTKSDDNVCMISHSLNSKLSPQKSFDCPLVVYGEITCSDWGKCIRNCAVVGLLPLFLFSKEIAVAPAKDCKEGDNFLSSDNIVRVIIDRWHGFESTASDVSLMYYLREQLSAAILYKVTHSTNVLLPVLRASVHALACILSCDGFSDISTSDPASQNTAIASACSLQSAHINDDATMTNSPISKYSRSASKCPENPNSLSWNASRAGYYQRIAFQWTFPDVGWMKANVDGSYKDQEHPCLAGCGGVFRDATGSWCFGFAQNLGTHASRSLDEENWDNTMTELWGIFTALKLAREKGISKLWIESDSNEALEILNRRRGDTSAFNSIVQSIIELMENWTVRISHCYREVNKVADWLAGYAHTTEVGLHVLDVPPPACVRFLTEDISGVCKHRSVRVSGVGRISLKIPFIDF